MSTQPEALTLVERLRNVQTNFGASRRQCDECGKAAWDSIDAAIAEIERLTAERDELVSARDILTKRAKNDSITLSAIVGMLSDPSYVPCEAEVKSLGSLRELVDRVRSERDAAQADAKRYRWLRDVSVPPHNFCLSVPIEFAGVRYTPAEVDAAIDAAIAAEGKSDV